MVPVATWLGGDGSHGAGVALIPKSASRFERPGVLFKSLTDNMIRIETALFVRKDQMRASVKDFIEGEYPASRR